MPGFDGTGPVGRGPTGGGRGNCAPAALGGDFGFGRGARYGSGEGLGRGVRGAGLGAGCGASAGRGCGGWGCRSQYHATGLYGWQRGRAVVPTDDQRIDALKAR